MVIPNPLQPQQLCHRCDPSQFSFQTTAELNDFNEIIGQTRAVEAIRFGIGIPHEGFNLFVLGANGTGKRTAVSQYLSQRVINEPRPHDYCYVYNFAHPHKPDAIKLLAGQGIQFRDDMRRLVKELSTVIQAAFSGDEYNLKKKNIVELLKTKENEALEELKAESEASGIAFVRTSSGIAFAPLVAGEVISPDAFLNLPSDQKDVIEKVISSLQEKLTEILNQVPQWHREIQNQLKVIHDETAVIAITPLFDELAQKYAKHPHILTYFDAVKADIVENVDDFVESDRSAISSLMGASSAKAKQTETPPTRYEVNLLVDHHGTEGAPLIYEDQPSYMNLVGRAEHIAQMGAFLTDFTLIKPGVLHRANGGYLILDAGKLLMQPYAWEGLKRAIRAQEIRIESLGQIYSNISTVSIEPEPIPLDIKVVLLGERQLYYLLYQYDPDFGELFKVAADFDDEMARDDINTMAYARLIGGLSRKEKLRHFDREAVARVIEYSSRLAGDVAKLSTHMQTISDVLREADFWAGELGHDGVTAVDVQHAIDAKIGRASRMRERIQEAIMRETIMIDTADSVVGQINGLSVYMLGNQAFGQPNRITARVRLGKGEVIDIERQVKMGGAIHSKGVMILSGFLGARYAAERPFSMNASLVFEQSYGSIDGDSASSAELYALMSALANVPIEQAFAVTGSVNQHGQVQAIGGVNEKIEGFFDLCQARGLSGAQGVLIPKANVKHLMLRQDVIDAVAENRFAIYPISHVDQGIELLTGMEAGELDEDGEYPSGSVNGRIISRLDKLAEKMRNFAPVPQN
ncbi:MAG: AAA family ATPase [Chloroflexi bacterium]|nr:AAA family ATPase [Chloroflexota bacterium]